MKNIFIYTTIVLLTLFLSCEKDFEPTINDGGSDISNTQWIKQFTIGKKTYFVTFSSPQLNNGVNQLQANIYLENMKLVTGYKIEIDPRMPDMENHSSPNNKPLEWNAEKNVYEGAVNLTMTGWWRLHLTVYNEKGNIISESGSIYWDIEI